jgi:formylglycine-generating enzyme required for sulfatase activity
MKSILTLAFLLMTVISHSQVKLTIKGDIKDLRTGEPLAYATIGVKERTTQTLSNADGTFELIILAGAHSDTLTISYIGYETFEKRVSQLASFEHITLREYATVLEEVIVSDYRFDARALDRTMRPIRGNVYAMDSETTNLEYNQFLLSLEGDDRKKYGFDLTGHKKSVKEFYQRYHQLSKDKPARRQIKNKDSTTVANHNDYPAVNISHDGAVEYCKWLTEEYNSSPKKKKFKKVLFRLPTLDEWQVAALGDPKFQSWKLLDNTVEVIITKDTSDMFKGPRKKMKVDDTILYPWYRVYFMRSRVYNQFGCYLGNFNIKVDRNCPSRALAYDGFTMTNFVRAYFPNDIGLYDVVGNVAEMIDVDGKACGGSWNEAPEKSTIQSVKNYNGPDETVGFRVFMEVVEK